ncbi:MAG: coniferyl aldehyde dehydrogenase, partial [Kangiellaceae bacterium]|nr:coniferyl aldehyde dehydrogenase [Kangiellaceae bacterium]
MVEVVNHEKVSSEDISVTQLLMKSILDNQRKAFYKEGTVDIATRVDRLGRAVSVLQNYKKEFCSAMSEDFGHRSVHQSVLTDIGGSIASLQDASKRLKKWIRPQRRKSMFPIGYLGASSKVEYQPLGVIGCISPWNFPLQLAFGPLAGMLSAGNRAMIKPSELTPATSDLFKKAIAESFDLEELAVITGDVETGRSFSQLNFDHLVYTGGSRVAKDIMREASNSLVPVTLELGGKSPVIIGKSADVESSAAKIIMGKTMNAGQVCLAPDYVFVHDDILKEFVASLESAFKMMYPSIKDNPDYTSIINEHHFDRLMQYIDDAELKGAKVKTLNPSDEDFNGQPHFKIPLTLVIDPTENMSVMNNEIFGPILLIKSFSSLEEPIDYINGRPRPLALYYFGHDRQEERNVLDRTFSGGVTVNDVLLHAAQDDLPFGGVG